MNRKEWQALLKPYAKSDHRKVVIQILNTVIPYILLLGSIFTLASRGVAFGWLLGPSIIAAGLMVRIFIFFHDCTHGSFTSSKKWNNLLGNFFSFFIFTPYIQWKVEHSIHHSTVGNLDERGAGDIWTITTEEYERSSRGKKFVYRLFRHPAFLFTVAPIFKFVVIQRFPKNYTGKKEKANYRKLNIVLFLYSAVMVSLFGWKAYFLYQLLVVGIAASAGIWLFYVQHQFEEVYWAEDEEWDLMEAALAGSTYYKLPPILEWFTGYIGYHHIHHLSARIPNYHLKACYDAIPELQNGKTVTVPESLHLALLTFYDEGSKRLITYRQYRQMKLMNS